MKKAKCLGLTYEQGDYYLSQRTKKGTPTSYKNGYKKTPTGFGWSTNVKPSSLTLHFEIDGFRGTTWVDRYFKDNVGKLTQNRVEKIRMAMPAEVYVEEYERNSGGTYYIVSEVSMRDWLVKTGL